VEAVLVFWLDLTRSDSTRGRQGTSEVALLSPPNGRTSRRRAAPVRSGAHLLVSRRASRARLKLEGRRQPTFYPGRGRRKACEARESSGSEGARAVGRLQKSVRVIFSALSPEPARVEEAALGSTDRPLLVTVEPERFGRQGCWVNERLPEQ
jgi:hypothetical protein